MVSPTQKQYLRFTPPLPEWPDQLLTSFFCECLLLDGSLFICTPVDPNFLTISYLDKARNKTEEHAGRFGVLQDALRDEAYPAAVRLAKASNARIEKICDVKDISDDERYVRWLLFLNSQTPTK